MKVYLDHAASTRVSEEVFDAMKPFFCEIYGNSGSTSTYGRAASKAVEKARGDIADCINCSPSEIYFTSSGTEADNWALKGIASAYKSKSCNLVVSSIEHHAVLNSANWLAENGFAVDVLPCDKNGVVHAEILDEMLTAKNVSLVSVMAVNNELGTIQPVKQLAEVAHKHNCLFHTDCVQAIPYVKIDVKDIDADLISFSAHKFNGPKGVGVLYVRDGVKIDRLINGGIQERNLRGGTVNTPSVVGMAKALCLREQLRDDEDAYVASLRYSFESRLSEISDTVVNAASALRVPSISNVMFGGVSNENLLNVLDLNGIAASGGAACEAGDLTPSHVALAIGLTQEQALSCIRFSFGEDNTREQVDYVVDVLKKSVDNLRKASTLFNYKKGDVTAV